jgi:hypothetical protein
MPYVEFEPTIPASERVKTVHDLDRWAIVTGHFSTYQHVSNQLLQCR